MKQLTRAITFKTIITLLIFNLIQTIIWAQDSAGTTTTTTTKSVTRETTSFFTSPLVWVVGGAIFILLLVALLRGNRNKGDTGRTDKVTVTKSVRTDTDTTS